MSKKKFTNSISGKGYYIALILCAIAIGITGYLYFRNADQEDARLAGKDTEVLATDPEQVQAIATDPQQVDGTRATGVTEPVSGGKLTTAAPVDGEVVAAYAMDALAYNQTTRDWRTHNGIDIAAEAGTQVKAAADGTVYTVYTDDTMGTTVVISHEGGYVTRYASLDAEVSVAPGDTVCCGDVIGAVGDTALLENAIGDHVHFSVLCNDEPVDPKAFLELG